MPSGSKKFQIITTLSLITYTIGAEVHSMVKKLVNMLFCSSEYIAIILIL